MLPCGRSIHWLLSLTSWRVHIHFCYFCWIHIHLFPRRVTWFVALLDFGLSWFVNFSAEPINLTGFPHFPRNSWNHSDWINIYCFLVFSQWIILVEYIYIYFAVGLGPTVTSHIRINLTSGCSIISLLVILEKKMIKISWKLLIGV